MTHLGVIALAAASILLDARVRIVSAITLILESRKTRRSMGGVLEIYPFPPFLPYYLKGEKGRQRGYFEIGSVAFADFLWVTKITSLGKFDSGFARRGRFASRDLAGRAQVPRASGQRPRRK